MARVGMPSIETAPHMIPRQLDGADIVGSLSLLMLGSMLGEVTSVLVQALLESPATTVLLPINTCKVEVVGAERRTLDALIRPSDVLRFCSGRTPEPDPSFFFPYYAQSDHEGLNRPRGDVCETMWTLLRSRDLIGSVVCAGWQL
ncbi:MAG: DUF3842 family protein [Nitrospira sp.]|nr:DUF3842 family protein [Nitrospira sp.]